jgi:hypothetical protein
VTISGRPVEIVALEAFRVVIGTPAGITPTVSLYATVILEGLLLRQKKKGGKVLRLPTTSDTAALAA